MSVQEILSKASGRWNRCQGAGNEALRLGILRDLDRQLHHQLTQFLAEGQSSDCQLMEAWLERIRNLKNATALSGELTTVLETGYSFQKISRSLPPELPEPLRDKLERKDRDWERAIAAAGLAEQWTIWTLDVWIELKSAESWHQNLLDGLWPSSIHLFVEPGYPLAEAHSSRWHGCWYLLMKPGFSPTEPALKDTHPSITNPDYKWSQVFPLIT